MEENGQEDAHDELILAQVQGQYRQLLVGISRFKSRVRYYKCFAIFGFDTLLGSGGNRGHCTPAEAANLATIFIYFQRHAMRFSFHAHSVLRSFECCSVAIPRTPSPMR